MYVRPEELSFSTSESAKCHCAKTVIEYGGNCGGKARARRVEQEPEQTEKPEQKRIRLKSLRSQIQATLNSLEAISNDPKQKKNCQSDAALKRADLLLDLSRLDHKKEVDAALAENATFHEQLDAKDARIAELETECEQLRASQHPVEIPLPRPEAPSH